MGVKCILLYKLPKGVLPVREDADRLVSALTQQLYCIPESSSRSLREQHGGERHLEASLTVFKQLQAPDPSLIAEPVSLKDVRLFKLHREAPHKLYLLLNQIASTSAYRVTEADPSIRTFLEKRLDYRQRGSLYIQSQSWLMGDKASDVTIKLLSVVQQGGQSSKVLALEVTYHPATLLQQAGPILQELADKISACVGPATGAAPGQAGTLVLLRPQYYRPRHLNDPNEPSSVFGAPHIVELYNELLQEGLLGR